LLGRSAAEFYLRVHAYALMDNHYHLLVETERGGLNRALRYLNGVYTQSFNRRHGRAGHLFQGRYKAILVEKESYLLELSRYIHLNPWRLKKSADPFAFRWSSLRGYVGQGNRPVWLRVEEVLDFFGKRGKSGYREFVRAGMAKGVKTPWEEVRGQTVIGSEEFVEEVAQVHVRGRERKGAELSGVRELAKVKAQDVLRAVEKYFGLSGDEIRGRSQRYTAPRYLASYLLRKYCLMRLWEIGESVGLHYSAVGNAIRRVREKPTDHMTKSLKILERNFKNQ
jgi:putative transposase